MRDERRDRPKRRGRIDREHIGTRCRSHDAGEIAHRIERQIPVEPRHRGETGVRQQQRVTIRGRAGDRLHADIAAPAAAVVDHHRNARETGERTAEQPPILPEKKDRHCLRHQQERKERCEMAAEHPRMPDVTERKHQRRGGHG